MSRFGVEQILALPYMGIFASALAYVLWFAGIARLPVSLAGAFSGIMPLAALALSAGFL